MQHTDYTPRQETSAVCDYDMYDRIWQRVSPDLNPYPHVRGEENEITPPQPQQPSGCLPSRQAADTDIQPETALSTCCMGNDARQSLDTLKGFLEEELAESRCAMALSRQVSHRNAARLLRQIAAEKREAARRLQAACYLIDGTCHVPEISVERTRFGSLAEALRHCYHQDACNGYHYQQAAKETTDSCLSGLMMELSKQSYHRADAVMRLLGEVLC